MWITQLTPTLGNGISSIQSSCSVMSDFLRPHEPQHARSPCPSPTPRVHPNPCPLSRWCHPTVSSSVVWKQVRMGSLPFLSYSVSETGRPAVLQSMGSSRVGHNGVTEQQQMFLRPSFLNSEMGQCLSPRALADSQVWGAAIWEGGGTLRILAYVFKPWRY